MQAVKTSVELIKQETSIYQPSWWQTKGGRFTVEDCSHRNASGARHAKSLGYKYEVKDHQTNNLYRASTLNDAKWWIQEQLKYQP